MGKKEKRAQLIAEMRELNEKVLAEKRAFTEDEEKIYNEKKKEMEQLSAEIIAEERQKLLDGFSTELPQNTDGNEKRNGNENPELTEFRQFLLGEKRTNMAVGTASSPGGGYVLAPQQFVKELIEQVEKETQLYSIVDKVPVSGAGSLGLPYEDVDASDASWTAEIPESDITADSSWKFGKRELKPNDLSKLVKITKKLIKASALPIDELVRRKVGKKILAAFENGILVGDGSGKPLGVFTASNDGVPTSRDVTSTPTSASQVVSADDLINTKMKLRPGYRKNAVWVMNTPILTQILLLKDKEDQYLWRPGLRDGEPDKILGIPVVESEYAPTTQTAGAYVAVLGDFRNYYKFAYWEGIDIQVLTEQFALKNQIGYLAHTLADGMPTLGEAFARLKVGTIPTPST